MPKSGMGCSAIYAWMDGRMMTFCIVVESYQCSKGMCCRNLREEDSKSLPRKPSTLRIFFHSCNLLWFAMMKCRHFGSDDDNRQFANTVSHISYRRGVTQSHTQIYKYIFYFLEIKLNKITIFFKPNKTHIFQNDICISWFKVGG